MELIDNVLISILAATDAVWVPDRDPRHPVMHVALYERRRDFAMRGVPWASDRVIPGLGATGRKQVQRVVEQALSKGLAIAFKPRTKTLGIRLTDAGEARARAMTGMAGFDDSLAMLQQLCDLQVAHRNGPCWIPETWLANMQWGDNRYNKVFVEVEEYLLPMLSRELVVSNGSIRGHIWYSVTKAGLKEATRLAKGKPSLVVKDKLPDWSEEARGEYYGRIKEELANLRTAQLENDREIGEIPLSLGIGLPALLEDRPASVPFVPLRQFNEWLKTQSESKDAS